LLNKLVDEDVLSQIHIDAVAALAVAIVSPAEAYGFGSVSIEQIAKALRG
jgi:hypothetical protein